MPITAIAELSLCGMACSSSLVPPCQLLLLAGPEHGRTIPLPEGHMASHIERRKFLATLGGAAAAWPLAARAQQGERMRHIGVLMPSSSDNAESQTRMGAFLQTLAVSGWTIGRNVRIDTRWGARDAERIQRHALELAALAPDVILAHGIST